MKFIYKPIMYNLYIYVYFFVLYIKYELVYIKQLCIISVV